MLIETALEWWANAVNAFHAASSIELSAIAFGYLEQVSLAL